jgi:hypothetical protein
MLVVERHKELAQTKHSSLVAMLLGQGTFDEFVDAIAHQTRIILYLMRGKTACLQGMVAGLTKVRDGIDECTVEVEND